MDRPISALLDLLFLLALLLPAPLIREGGRRWGGYVGWRTLMQLARLVPASPSAIRCPSIFVSALHAWRRRPAGGKGSAAASNSPLGRRKRNQEAPDELTDRIAVAMRESCLTSFTGTDLRLLPEPPE